MHSLFEVGIQAFMGGFVQRTYGVIREPLFPEGGPPTLLGHYSLLSVFKDLSVISQEYGAQSSATGII